MHILALDLGTTTGWAVGNEHRIVASGAHTHKAGRYESGGMRYLKFNAWLGQVMVSMGGAIDAIYFEEVRGHKGVDAAHVYGGLLATLTAWCEERKIPYTGIPVGTIKSFATGKGNSGKPLMVAAASKLLGRPLTENDHDEADAVCLLKYAMQQAPGRARQRF